MQKQKGALAAAAEADATDDDESVTAAASAEIRAPSDNATKRRASQLKNAKSKKVTDC